MDANTQTPTAPALPAPAFSFPTWPEVDRRVAERRTGERASMQDVLDRRHAERRAEVRS